MFQPGAPRQQSVTFTVGHETLREAKTGCTVVLCDRPTLAAVDVRGGAPGTRETDLLATGRLVQRVDAILLTGGSAFGLAAADGVMRYLGEHRRGVQTGARPVPIVPAAVIYDFNVGQAIAPDATAGWNACVQADPIELVERGLVGAGVGATTAKIDGPTGTQRGGFGVGFWSWHNGTVTALAVVNAFGRVMPPESIYNEQNDPVMMLFTKSHREKPARESTTLIVVLVDSPVDHSTLTLCNVAAHDAMARTIRPAHTIVDGDVAFALALQEQATVSPTAALQVAAATQLAVERAILDAITAVM